MSSDNENDFQNSTDVVEDDDNDDNVGQPPNQNEMIDKMTLELLMNKGHYHKYMANADPEQHEKQVRFRSQLSKYKHKIISITNELITSQTKQITTDVNDAFTDYVKTLIQYFQMKEMENKSHTDDEDILFGSIENYDDENKDTVEAEVSSLWGGGKVVKRKATNMNAFMYGFPKK